MTTNDMGMGDAVDNPVAEAVMSTPAVEPAIDILQSPFYGLHWTKLKAMVEAAGGEYTDKDEVVLFLEKRRLAAEAASSEAVVTDTSVGESEVDDLVKEPAAPEFPRFNVLEPYAQNIDSEGSIYIQNGHKYIEGGKCIGPVDE